MSTAGGLRNPTRGSAGDTSCRPGIDVGALYRDSRRRIAATIVSCGPGSASREVAACPGWDVADVIAHLVGVIEDAVAGRIHGPPSDEQTARQVARHRNEPINDLLTEWENIAPRFESAISDRHIVAAFLDALSHEHDIHTALHQPGDRNHPAITIAARHLATIGDVPVRIELTDEPTQPPSPLDGTWLLRTTAFEVFRFRLGRRTRQQVHELCWSHDPTPILDHLFVFGPASTPSTG